jgi:hypothetical protein
MAAHDPDGDVSKLIEMATAIRPVFRELRTFMADAIEVESADVCREALLRLPRALELSESLDP